MSSVRSRDVWSPTYGLHVHVGLLEFPIFQLLVNLGLPKSRIFSWSDLSSSLTQFLSLSPSFPLSLSLSLVLLHFLSLGYSKLIPLSGVVKLAKEAAIFIPPTVVEECHKYVREPKSLYQGCI